MTQIEFVKQLPAELPIETVVEKAKAQGLKLRPERVRVIRRELKKGRHLSLVPAEGKAKRGRPPKDKQLENMHQKLVQIAFTIGIVETRRVVDEAVARVLGEQR